MEFLRRMTSLEVANGTPQTIIGVGLIVLAATIIVRGIGRLIGRLVRP